MPYVGRPVLVVYLGSHIPGVVTQVCAGGRCVTVRTEEDETLSFSLNRATAVFRAEGARDGPRLVFDIEAAAE